MKVFQDLHITEANRGVAEDVCEVKGDLRIDVSSVSLPQLTHVSGTLTIMGDDVSAPALALVTGDVNIAGASFRAPLLYIIAGGMGVYAAGAQLPTLESISESLDIAAVGAELPSLTTVQMKVWIEADDARLPVLEIVGASLTIRGKNASLPKLRRIEGGLTVDTPGAQMPELQHVFVSLDTYALLELPKLANLAGEVGGNPQLLTAPLLGYQHVKKPAFFVQNNYVQRITEPVSEFVRAKGYALEDRSTSAEFDPEDCGIDWNQYHPVLPYGSVQFVRHLKKSPALGRYMLYSEEAFSTAHWSAIFGKRAVNHRGGQATAAAVTARLAAGENLHVRPDREDKAFTAAVFGSGTWQALCEERGIKPELDCWASPVVQLHGEWRCWVIGGKVIEISQYRKEGKPHRVLETDPAIHAAAQALGDVYLPAQAVVMDIAATDEGIQVLEFNPIHGAGWYAARVGFVLESWLQWAIAHFGPADA